MCEGDVGTLGGERLTTSLMPLKEQRKVSERTGNDERWKHTLKCSPFENALRQNLHSILSGVA